MQIEARNRRLRPRPKALVSARLFLNVFQGCLFHNCNIFQIYGLYTTHNLKVCSTFYGSGSLLVRDVSFTALVELSAVLSSSVRSGFRQVSVRRQVKTCSRPVPAFLPCLSQENPEFLSCHFPPKRSPPKQSHCFTLLFSVTNRGTR